jgi:DNA-binding transcriptional LysR family regulator
MPVGVIIRAWDNGLMQAMHEKSWGQLDQIEAFVAIAEHGGFAAAACVLDKDSSVLSRRIDALERRVGVRLFARTTRKVGLTKVGAAYLQKVRIVLAELTAADGAARPRGLLRVTMSRTFARLWVVPWLPAFLRDYPEIELELGDRYFDLVGEGFDLAAGWRSGRQLVDCSSPCILRDNPLLRLLISPRLARPERSGICRTIAALG